MEKDTIKKQQNGSSVMSHASSEKKMSAHVISQHSLTGSLQSLCKNEKYKSQ